MATERSMTESVRRTQLCETQDVWTWFTLDASRVVASTDCTAKGKYVSDRPGGCVPECVTSCFHGNEYVICCVRGPVPAECVEDYVPYALHPWIRQVQRPWLHHRLHLQKHCALCFWSRPCYVIECEVTSPKASQRCVPGCVTRCLPGCVTRCVPGRVPTAALNALKITSLEASQRCVPGCVKRCIPV